jgi:GntR family transcriptional regulator/MocR family aminotransferase
VVLENDHNFEFRHGGPPVESLQALDVDGRVVHVGTFTRLRPGGLHVNYMVVPESWIDLFDAALSLSGSVASALEQRTLAAFVREGHLERLNRRARRRAREQREAMVDAVRNFLGERVHLRVPGAGFHVHVTLQTVRPREIDALLAVAANEGVRLYPDLPFHWKAPKHPGLILGFGDLTTARIDEGISRLARVLDERRWAGGGT